MLISQQILSTDTMTEKEVTHTENTIEKEDTPTNVAAIERDTEIDLAAEKETGNILVAMNVKESTQEVTDIGNTQEVIEIVILGVIEVEKGITLVHIVTLMITPITGITPHTPHTTHAVITRREVILNTD